MTTAAYQQTYYKQHKEAQRPARRQVTRKREKQAREWVAGIKAAGQCARCGYCDCPAALDFHHPNDDKIVAVSKLYRKGWRRERIMEELAKCILLCANCHRAEHHCQK